MLKNAVPATWEGTPIRVIALDDLIANKRAAASAQDLAGQQEAAVWFTSPIDAPPA